MQQEHIFKLDTNFLASSFDDLDEEHAAWLKKKNTKLTGQISYVIESTIFCLEELNDHVVVLLSLIHIQMCIRDRYKG